MNLKKVVIIGVAGIVFSAGLQAATISSSDSLEILALDGKAIDTDGLFDRVHSVDTQGGTHQVTFRYYSGVNDGGNRAIYSTQPYVFTIHLKPDDKVKVLGPTLTTYSQAQAYFLRHVDWRVRYSDGREESVSYDKLTGEGLAPFANIEKALAAYNQKKGNQFAPKPAVTPHNTAIAQKTFNKADDSLIQAVQALYNNATPEQKARLKAWVAAQ